jgi:hypothetical protein
MTTIRLPAAAARCMGPESLVTVASQRLRRAADWRTVNWPLVFRTRPGFSRSIWSPTSPASRPPTIRRLQSRFRQRVLATSRKFSPGQIFRRSPAAGMMAHNLRPSRLKRSVTLCAARSSSSDSQSSRRSLPIVPPNCLMTSRLCNTSCRAAFARIGSVSIQS